MRHFLRHYLCLAKSPLPRGMLAGAFARALVFVPCDMLRLSPLQEGAAASAVQLAVIAGAADVDLLFATPTAEGPRAVDHLHPTAHVSGHGLRDERWSGAEHRSDHRDDPEGSGGNPGLRLVSGPTGLHVGGQRYQDRGASDALRRGDRPPAITLKLVPSGTGGDSARWGRRATRVLTPCSA